MYILFRNAAIVLLFIILSILPATTHACECGELDTIQSRLPTLDAVFAGTIGTTTIRGLFRVMTFEVSEVWKGKTDKKITIESMRVGGSCGWFPKEGVEYVIHARVYPSGMLRTSSCDGNEPLAQSSIRAEIGNGTATLNTSSKFPTAIARPIESIPVSPAETSADGNQNTDTSMSKAQDKVAQGNDASHPEEKSFTSWLVGKIRLLFTSWF